MPRPQILSIDELKDENMLNIFTNLVTTQYYSIYNVYKIEETYVVSLKK